MNARSHTQTLVAAFLLLLTSTNADPVLASCPSDPLMYDERDSRADLSKAYYRWGGRPESGSGMKHVGPRAQTARRNRIANLDRTQLRRRKQDSTIGPQTEQIGEPRVTHWRIVTSIGFGLAGNYFGQCEAPLCDKERHPGIGAVIGFLVGRAIGRRVDENLAKGLTPSPSQRMWVRLGTLLVGTFTGIMVGDLIEGRSERDFKPAGAAGGALIGAYVQIRWDHRLFPKLPGVNVDLDLSRGVALRFGL